MSQCVCVLGGGGGGGGDKVTLTCADYTKNVLVYMIKNTSLMSNEFILLFGLALIS